MNNADDEEIENLLREMHNMTKKRVVHGGDKSKLGNLGFVQTLQVKYNEVKHALTLSNAQCAELKNCMTRLHEEKTLAITHASQLQIRLENREKEIQTLRSHVDDLYDVQQKLRAESLQKDVQLMQQQQQQRPSVVVDDCHTCVCHSNAPSIAWKSEEETVVEERFNMEGVVQSLRNELRSLEEQVQHQSEELHRANAALCAQTANIASAAEVDALREEIRHAQSTNETEEASNQDDTPEPAWKPRHQLPSRRQAIFVPSTDDRELLPTWLAEALANVEETMDEASQELDMDVLHMELASLRRSLERKDDEIFEFERVVDFMHEQLGALKTQHRVADIDDMSPLQNTFVAAVHAIVVQEIEARPEDDTDDDIAVCVDNDDFQDEKKEEEVALKHGLRQERGHEIESWGHKLSLENKNLRGEISELCAEAAKQQARHVKIVGQWRHQVAALALEFDALRQMHTLAQRDNVRRELDFAAELSHAKDQIKIGERQQQVSQMKCEDYQMRIFKLEERLQDHENVASAVDDLVAKLQDVVRTEVETKRAAQAAAEVLQLENSKLTTQLDEHVCRADAKEHQWLEKVQFLETDYKSDIEATRVEMNAKLEMIERLELEVSSLTSFMKVMEALHDQQINAMEAQIVEWKRRCARCEDELKIKAEASEALTTQHAFKCEEHVRLSRDREGMLCEDHLMCFLVSQSNNLAECLRQAELVQEVRLEMEEQQEVHRGELETTTDILKTLECDYLALLSRQKDMEGQDVAHQCARAESERALELETMVQANDAWARVLACKCDELARQSYNRENMLDEEYSMRCYLLSESFRCMHEAELAAKMQRGKDEACIHLQEARRVDLEATLKTLTSENATLSTQLNQSENQLSRLCHDMEMSTQKIISLETTKDELSAQLKEVETQHVAQCAEIDTQWQESVSQANSQASNWRHQCGSYEAQLQKATEVHASHCQIMAQEYIDRTVQSIERAEMQMEEHLTRMRATSESHVGECIQMRMKEEDLLSAIKGLEAICTRWELDYREAMVSHRIEVDENIKAIESLKSENKTLETQLIEANVCRATQCAMADVKLTLLENFEREESAAWAARLFAKCMELERLSQNREEMLCEDHSMRFLELQSSIVAQSTHGAELAQEMRHEMDERQARLQEAYRGELGAAGDALKTLEARNSTLVTQIKELAAIYEHQNESHRAELATSNHTINSLESENSALRDIEAQKSAQLEALRIDKETTTRAIEVLKSQSLKMSAKTKSDVERHAALVERLETEWQEKYRAEVAHVAELKVQCHHYDAQLKHAMEAHDSLRHSLASQVSDLSLQMREREGMLREEYSMCMQMVHECHWAQCTSMRSKEGKLLRAIEIVEANCARWEDAHRAAVEVNHHATEEIMAIQTNKLELEQQVKCQLLHVETIEREYEERCQRLKMELQRDVEQWTSSFDSDVDSKLQTRTEDWEVALTQSHGLWCRLVRDRETMLVEDYSMRVFIMQNHFKVEQTRQHVIDDELRRALHASEAACAERDLVHQADAKALHETEETIQRLQQHNLTLFHDLEDHEDEKERQLEALEQAWQVKYHDLELESKTHCEALRVACASAARDFSTNLCRHVETSELPDKDNAGMNEVPTATRGVVHESNGDGAGAPTPPETESESAVSSSLPSVDAILRIMQTELLLVHAANVEATVRDWQRKCNDAEAANQALREALAHREAQCTAFETDQRLQKGALEEVAADLAMNVDLVDQLELELDARRGEVGDLLCDVAKAQSEADDAREALAKCLLELAAHRQECEHLKALVDEMDARNHTFRRERLQKETRLVERLHGELHSLEMTYQAQVNHWKSQAKHLERRVVHWRHALSAVHLEMDEWQGSAESMLRVECERRCDEAVRQRTQDHESRVAAVERTLRQRDDLVRNLEEKLQHETLVVAQKDKDMSIWMECTMAMQLEIQEVRTALEEAESRSVQLERHVEMLQGALARENIKWGHRLGAIQLEMHESGAAAAASQAQLESQIRTLENDNHRLETARTLECCNIDNITAEESLDAMAATIEAHERERLGAHQRFRCRELEIEVVARQADVDRMVNAEQTLQHQLTHQAAVHEAQLQAFNTEWLECTQAMQVDINRLQMACDECGVKFQDALATKTRALETLRNDMVRVKARNQDLVDALATTTSNLLRHMDEATKWRHVVCGLQLEMDESQAHASRECRRLLHMLHHVKAMREIDRRHGCWKDEDADKGAVVVYLDAVEPAKHAVDSPPSALRIRRSSTATKTDDLFHLTAIQSPKGNCAQAWEPSEADESANDVVLQTPATAQTHAAVTPVDGIITKLRVQVETITAENNELRTHVSHLAREKSGLQHLLAAKRQTLTIDTTASSAEPLSRDARPKLTPTASFGLLSPLVLRPPQICPPTTPRTTTIDIPPDIATRDVLVPGLPSIPEDTDVHLTWNSVRAHIASLQTELVQHQKRARHSPRNASASLARLHARLRASLSSSSLPVGASPMELILHDVGVLLLSLGALLAQPRDDALEAKRFLVGHLPPPLESVWSPDDRPPSTAPRHRLRRGKAKEPGPIECAGMLVLHIGAAQVLAGVAGVAPPLVHMPTPRGIFRRGEIVQWDALEALVARVFQRLGVHEARYKVVLLHKPHVSTMEKERMIDLLVDGFGVQGVNLTTHAQMALLAQEKHTGLVIDIGVDAIFLVPIFEDMVLQHATVKLAMGGADVARHVASHLSSTASAHAHHVLHVERRLLEGGKEAAAWPTTDLLFAPSLGHPYCTETTGLVDAVRQCVSRCDAVLHDVLLANVLLTGGPAALPGLATRLQRALDLAAPIPIAPTGNGGAGVYAGACLHATTLSPYKWVLKHDYVLHGARIVHTKCF
ncbi:Aste57867_12606 [Aphanomyces stellatus]|uniref:Aste57867_12606 protein n=1 Tax=Aphanomyces stellatus TaxID=120398 RepID=A0A485KW25_9STRA|nr:hypothetical protein As57867_012560 [Aphanomyces stellatus]VFT89456.1 Aste57867_12606 [Aphanomyces stellatus]